MKEKRSYKNTKYKNKIENECQSLFKIYRRLSHRTRSMETSLLLMA